MYRTEEENLQGTSLIRSVEVIVGKAKVERRTSFRVEIHISPKHFIASFSHLSGLLTSRADDGRISQNSTNS